jgi:hypothetical protein
MEVWGGVRCPVHGCPNEYTRRHSHLAIIYSGPVLQGGKLADIPGDR